MSTPLTDGEKAELMAAYRVQRRAEDFRMLMDPQHWPAWPYLPMKRAMQTGRSDVACVTESDVEGKWLLYENVNMFLFPCTYKGEVVTPEALSIDEILDRGWYVD